VFMPGPGGHDEGIASRPVEALTSDNRRAAALCDVVTAAARRRRATPGPSSAWLAATSRSPSAAWACSSAPRSARARGLTRFDGAFR
jgi:hypothetical protein